MQLSGEGPVMPAGAVWAEWLVEENHVPRWESVCVPKLRASGAEVSCRTGRAGGSEFAEVPLQDWELDLHGNAVCAAQQPSGCCVSSGRGCEDEGKGKGPRCLVGLWLVQRVQMVGPFPKKSPVWRRNPAVCLGLLRRSWWVTAGGGPEKAVGGGAEARHGGSRPFCLPGVGGAAPGLQGL